MASVPNYYDPEQIVFNHLSKFITQNNILSVSQFGFRPNHSCCQQLLVFLHNVLEAIDSNISCDAIYLDFRKAFDSVPHKELLLKLWKVGITANTWHWIKNYLTDRRQYVSINNSNSPLLPVVSGVPQGSILGPLLFLVFVNDLPAGVCYSTLLLFADDANAQNKSLAPMILLFSKMTSIRSPHGLINGICSSTIPNAS